ncbi:hypothetical protein [Labilibaculum filiforme]|nr:hypothetical protein [Labilibaculum filiforme]
MITCLVICLASFQLFSQEHLPHATDYKHFYTTKTLVVLEDNPFCEYNYKIKEAVEENWKATAYEFISIDEFQKKKHERNYSFLVTSTVTFNKDKTNAQYHFLSLVLGGPAEEIGNMPDLCSIPLSYVNVDEATYIYKLSSIVEFMQNHIALVNKNPEIITENILKYYNKNSAETKYKTLYLLKDELSSEINTLAKISKVYSGKVKLVTADEIEEAIRNKNSQVIFLHKVGPEHTKSKARCFKILIGASDAKFYYFDFHMVKGNEADGFLKSDFKKID